jgi:exonuclease VII small subunit
MSFTDLAPLAGTFGAPAALLIWMWVQTQSRPRAVSEADSLSSKLDRLTDRLDAAVDAFEKADTKIDNLSDRMTKLETIVEERRPTSRRT